MLFGRNFCQKAWNTLEGSPPKLLNLAESGINFCERIVYLLTDPAGNFSQRKVLLRFKLFFLALFELNDCLFELFVFGFKLFLQASYHKLVFDPHQYFVDLKRFGNIIDTADRKCLNFVYRFVTRTDKDNGDILSFGVSFKLFTNLITIKIGHGNIEQNQVWRTNFGCGKSELAVGDGSSFVIVFGENIY